MLEKTLYSDGKNNFEDNTFSAKVWSAPTMVSPEEIRKRLSSFKLEGRIIGALHTIGLNYNLQPRGIETYAYKYLEQYEDEERQKRSEYHNIDPEMPYGCCSEIDEPFLIRFKDGDVFEIITPQEPEFRMSMNCIPWDIEAGTNMPNADANVIYASCIGKTVINVEVRTFFADKDPMFHDFLDEEHRKRELVSEIILWLDDGNGISISGDFDYCDIAYINKKGSLNKIPFGELKKGLSNWEDLHMDASIGFKAESPSLFFGENSLDYVEDPYITLRPDNREIALYIAYEEDFLLFDWTITCFKRESFDEYGSYKFSFQQWKEIIEIAERIVSFTSFDDLFDYLLEVGNTNSKGSGAKKNMFLWRLNYMGEYFWNNRKKYLIQLKDMKAWSELALSADGTMGVYGY